ncbi:hypothetical protein [Pararhodobacter sp. CCB-MM2]|uniref:hypothetical protein n=1 Tax=Pararhodobacter sp. CCB-MM2 TaxID=1786003 RepID=UPI0013148B1B|nr:hypothetical protein [Pararhodobacter sp. CCB-MM2]
MKAADGGLHPQSFFTVLAMTCHRLILALSLAATFSATAALAEGLPGPRPFDAMRGTCSDFAIDISRETQAWASGNIVALAASPTPTSGSTLSPGVVTRLTLIPQSDVQFPVSPEQDRNAQDRFAGHVNLNVPHAGLWRVAASNGVWFDAIVDGTRVVSSAFEMQTGCTAPFKVVVFALRQGPIGLQLNGSPTETVELVLLPWFGQ